MFLYSQQQLKSFLLSTNGNDRGIYWHLRDSGDCDISREGMMSLFHPNVVKVDFSPSPESNKKLNQLAFEMTKAIYHLTYLIVGNSLVSNRIHQLMFYQDMRHSLEMITLSNITLTPSQVSTIGKAIELNHNIQELNLEAIRIDTMQRCYQILRATKAVASIKVDLHRTTMIELEGVLQVLKSEEACPCLTRLIFGGYTPNAFPILKSRIDSYVFGRRLFAALISVDDVNFTYLKMTAFYNEMKVPMELSSWYRGMTAQFRVESLHMVS